MVHRYIHEWTGNGNGVLGGKTDKIPLISIVAFGDDTHDFATFFFFYRLFVAEAI